MTTRSEAIEALEELAAQALVLTTNARNVRRFNAIRAFLEQPQRIPPLGLEEFRRCTEGRDDERKLWTVFFTAALIPGATVHDAEFRADAALTVWKNKWS